MRDNGPKVKISRRLGVAVTPKAAKIMNKKPYPPGQRNALGRRPSSKMSNFKRQLLEKQKLRAQYNIREKQMHNYFKKASRKEGNTVDNFVQMLETRLDAFVFRAGLARTIYAARQYVSHGHVTVNNKRVDKPSYQIKIGDVISIKEKSRTLPCFAEAVQNAQPADYIDFTKDSMEAKLQLLPKRDDIPVICEVPQVIEFYSR